MSYETELELKLVQLNSKIIIYDRYVKLRFIGKLFMKRTIKIINQRDQCFRELRELVRKKHPELFLGDK